MVINEYIICISSGVAHGVAVIACIFCIALCST